MEITLRSRLIKMTKLLALSFTRKFNFLIQFETCFCNSSIRRTLAELAV